MAKKYASAVAVLEMLECLEDNFGGMTTSVEAMLVNPNPVRPVGVTTRVGRKALPSANAKTSARVPPLRTSPQRSGKSDESSDIGKSSQRRLDLYSEKKRVRLCFLSLNN